MDPRDWLFDKRIVRRNLENGILPMDQYEKYLSELENLAKECEVVDALLYEPEEQNESKETEGQEASEGDDVLKTEKILGSFHGVLDE